MNSTDLQFWRSFYEAAAAVRGTTAGGSTDADDTHTRSTYEDETVTLNHQDEVSHSSFSSAHRDPDQDLEDGSFVFGAGVTASTPLRNKRTNGMHNSWEDSMESPFEKTERLLQDMRIGTGDSMEDSSDMPTPSLPAGYSLASVTRDSVGSNSKSSTSIEDSVLGARTDPAPRASSSTPKANRTVPITDLRNTPLNAKFPNHHAKGKASAHKPRSYLAPTFDFGDDSDDDIVTGMSPPRTMNFGTLPPRAQAMQAVARDNTPRKDSNAQAILDDLLSEMNSHEPSPKMPTPEEFKRYSLLPEEMGAEPVRRLFDGQQPSGSGTLAPPAVAREVRRSMANTSFGSDIVVGRPEVGRVIGDDSYEHDDSFSSDGSGTVPAPPDYGADMSYMTNTPGPAAGHAGDFSTTMHPSQRDQMRDTEVFGPPGGQPQSGGSGPFGLMKMDEMYTFHGGRLEDAAGREVEDTPVKEAKARHEKARQEADARARSYR